LRQITTCGRYPLAAEDHLLQISTCLTIPHSTFDIQHSTFDIKVSTFNIQNSTFNVKHFTFEIRTSTCVRYPLAANIHLRQISTCSR
jgi:hypothetical protein